MVDVSKLNAEELDELMTKCRIREDELKRESISSMQEEASKNIGRCFKVGEDYVKIIGIPGVELTKTGVYFNPFQYPSLRLGYKSDPLHRFQNPIPFYCDDFHSSAWGVGRNPFCEQITEVELGEFIEEWKRRIEDFTKKYVEDVVGGVNCGG